MAKEVIKKQTTLKQYIFLGVGLLLVITTLLVLLLGGASYVNNSKSGVEVSVSGLNLVQALLTWDFKSTSYGDIAVPFYYYAKEMTITLSIFVFVGVILVSISLLLSLVSLITRNSKINMITFYILLATSIYLLVTFILALFMGTTKILPKYCGGNPNCAMHSIIIIPAIACFGAAIMHSMFEYKKNNL